MCAALVVAGVAAGVALAYVAGYERARHEMADELDAQRRAMDERKGR